MTNKLTYIIDDDQLSVKLVSLLINKNEFCQEIKTFYDAQSALDEIAKNIHKNDNLPDVILLDLNMPVIDGWQFLDEFILLPLQKEIAIFIVTSSIDPVDIEMANEYKAVKTYIMKPITASKLKSISVLINP